jgi:toxin ParE1/3/4
MKTEILSQAEVELAEAIAYYEEIEPGLGVRLKDETQSALLWIRNNHELPRLRAKGYRRVNLKVFPYYVAYFVWAERIWVLAVAHSRRGPEYWLERKRSIH